MHGEYLIFFIHGNRICQGLETRNLFQSCIDAAVKTLKDTVYVEANRDTRGELWKPGYYKCDF